MSLTLMYITNDPEIALIAENNDVEWIFVDLEILGKSERQKGKDSLISNHNADDVKKLKSVLKKSKVLVRINPINKNTPNEIKKVYDNGAAIIMLPYFKSLNEVEVFLKNISGKNLKNIILIETPESVELIEELIKINEIDYFYIGLNDLSLGYGFSFMFEPLANGTVDKLALKINSVNKRFGFGGIASLGKGTLPAEYIIAEHYRLGSSMVILSRSFCNSQKIENKDEIEKIFSSEIKKIRDYEKDIEKKEIYFFEQNREKVKEIVKKINERVDGFRN
ncbi:TPA: aldolase [candidate division WOR-3 bacterium]|nr:aldolase [candidate division WOR-3 bacterium]